MDALFFISIGCFFALFVAALAIARHLRFDVPRSSRSRSPSPAPQPRERLTLPHVGEQQDLHHLAQHKQPDWRFLISEERRRRQSRNPDTLPARKPPTSASRLGETLRSPLQDSSTGTYGRNP